MKTIYFNSETIVAFHIGRGGRFHNQGHVSFVGEHKIGDFIDNLFWDTDDEGNAIQEAELRDESGNNVGCTWADIETGVGRIDIDGEYDTTYTMKLADVEQDSKEWNAIFAETEKDFDAEQAQMFLRPELAIEEMQELADYINNHEDWQLVVSEIIKRNSWEDETGDTYGVCSDGGWQKIVLNEKGIAEVIEEED